MGPYNRGLVSSSFYLHEKRARAEHGACIEKWPRHGQDQWFLKNQKKLQRTACYFSPSWPRKLKAVAWNMKRKRGGNGGKAKIHFCLFLGYRQKQGAMMVHYRVSSGNTSSHLLRAAGIEYHN